ncbi:MULTISPECIES: alpha/beta hydrolase [unclassified Azospirillum]|uniref:alpha/beta hydrolase n=1 Tax=unclassified Azospirillum TaxID=2630922 RepID=UPI000B6EE873|nr:MULTISPECIES: alpha/beta hydrolase [unclassified Azospirillum]SNS47535.1 Acetyl esterase/lipase [Azospirillum sp. RU38E]SNS66673.1 Acetyl esterase/lipase [Azospirillum sp. RU37A]
MQRRTLFTTAAATALLAAGLPGTSHAADVKGETLSLWPGDKPPGGDKVTVKQSEVARSDDPRFRDVAILNVTQPNLTLFRPAKPNGAAMLIIPGGGYQRVVVGKEGYDIAQWLAGEGVTVFVLLYRLPADGWAAGPDAPLQDAQRAIRLIRAGAKGWGIDPARIGVMGFSAGGHLAAMAATRFDKVTYKPVDAADQVSARPDIAALGYPVISMVPGIAHAGSAKQMLGENPAADRVAEFSADQGVPANAPPSFITAAADDAVVPVENSLLIYAALRKAGAKVAMHLFEAGGHGFGLRSPKAAPVAAWPALFIEWGRSHGFV